MNNGAVYAVFDYQGQNTDELTMKIGDMFHVLRKGDEQEKEWWWSRLGDREGYIPRNLLGVSNSCYYCMLIEVIPLYCLLIWNTMTTCKHYLYSKKEKIQATQGYVF